MYIIKIPTTKGKHLLVTSQARSRGKKEIEAREKNTEPDKNKAEVNPPPPPIHYSSLNGCVFQFSDLNRWIVNRPAVQLFSKINKITSLAQL